MINLKIPIQMEKCYNIGVLKSGDPYQLKETGAKKDWANYDVVAHIL